MKKLKLLLLSLLLIIPVGVKAEEATGQLEPVKVYVFYAPGCHWCEEQFNYLENLDSLDDKFVIVRKELFKSDLRTPGDDYDLGQAVGDAFVSAGFKDGRPSGTPYVVVSDIYAQSAYNDSLESVIDQAYEAGDKDVVGCIEAGKDDCIAGAVKEKTEISPKTIAILAVSVAIIIPLLIVINKQMNKIPVVEEKPVKEEKEEVKVEVKKTSPKTKTPTAKKKTSTKKTTSTKKKEK